MISQSGGLLHRRAVVAELLRERGDLLVIAGLGAPNWDVTAAGDHPNTFPLWGAMGSAAMIGLGLALAQPKRRVLVITGDGDMLMAMGSFATIGAKQPKNLAIIVMDNEHAARYRIRRCCEGYRISRGSNHLHRGATQDLGTAHPQTTRPDIRWHE